MGPNRRWELRHSCRIKSRKTLNLRNSILNLNYCDDCVEQYDINTDTLATLGQSNISNNLEGFSVTAYNGYLYTIGGSVWLLDIDGSTSYSNSVDRYHLKENVWSKGAPMIHPRTHHAAQLLYGLIYVTGGDSLDEHVSSAECYDPDADQWMEIKSMNHERRDHRIAEVNGLIFAVGGNLEQCLCTGDTVIGDTVIANSVEFYDPAKDTWMCVRSTLKPKYFSEAASIGGCLYVLGTYLNSMERYDVQMDQWFSCLSTTIYFDEMRLLSHNGYLYACHRNPAITVAIERYNPSTQTWEICGNKKWPNPFYNNYATEMLD